MLHFNTIANEPRYLEAAQKAIALCEKVLLETEQYDRITDVYLNYQEITGEAFYQEKLEKWVDEVLASSLASEQILPDTLIISRTKGRSFGINVENSIKFLAGPTSSQYLKGFKVTGNLGYLVRSMRLAARELNLVTYSTRDGREHGCASHKFIHGCGEDAAHALYEATAIDKIRYYKADGSLGLDDDLAVMVDSLEDDTAKLYFYNRATEQKIVQVGFVDSDSSQYKSSFIIEPGVVNKVEVSK